MAESPSKGGGKVRSHLLRLAPESAQVREVAKSWAAGEIGLDDYRMIRTITLEGMLSGEIPLPGEPSADITDVTVRPNQTPDDDPDATQVGDDTADDLADITEPNPEPVAEPAAAGAPSAPRVAWLAGVILLVLGVILLLTLI